MTLKERDATTTCEFAAAVRAIDPIVRGVTVIHTAKTPNKRTARRAKRKAKK